MNKLKLVLVENKAMIVGTPRDVELLLVQALYGVDKKVRSLGQYLSSTSSKQFSDALTNYQALSHQFKQDSDVIDIQL